MLILIAFRNLMQHRRRTLLIGGAIAAVTALWVSLLGISGGLRETLFERATTLYTGHLNVEGFFKVTPSSSFPAIADAAPVLEVVRREFPDAQSISVRTRGWLTVVGPQRSMQLAPVGIDLENEPRLRETLRIKQGRLEELNEPGTVLLFEGEAEKIGAGVGDTVVLLTRTITGAYNTVDTRVVAIAEPFGMVTSGMAFTSNQTLRSLYRLQDGAAGLVLVYFDDPARVPAAAARLREVLSSSSFELMEQDTRMFYEKLESINKESWTGQRLDLTTWEATVAPLAFILGILDGLTTALVVLLLAIIILGLMNTMAIAVRERTREIGTLRAIGMPRRRVMAMFVVEALVLTAVAASIGALVGVAACALLTSAQLPLPGPVRDLLARDVLYLSVDAARVLWPVALMTVFITLASLLPSARAARLPPINAMHHLG